MEKKTIIVRLVIFIAIMAAIVLLMRVVVKATVSMTNYDEFTQCLANKEVKFYGAFWCPHCQAQKKRFGGSAKYLPYIECSTPDGKSQKQSCVDASIKSYPTWVFPDGSRVEHEMELVDLAEKTSCALPTESTKK